MIRSVEAGGAPRRPQPSLEPERRHKVEGEDVQCGQGKVFQMEGAAYANAWKYAFMGYSSSRHGWNVSRG